MSLWTENNKLFMQGLENSACEQKKKNSLHTVNYTTLFNPKSVNRTIQNDTCFKLEMTQPINIALKIERPVNNRN